MIDKKMKTIILDVNQINLHEVSARIDDLYGTVGFCRVFGLGTLQQGFGNEEIALILVPGSIVLQKNKTG